MVYGINGVKDNLTVALDTVSQYQKEFIAGWRYINTVIPANITLSITNICSVYIPLFSPYQSSNLIQFIKGPLANKLKMPRKKRLRRFTTKNHFIYLGRQLQIVDWVAYKRPAIKIGDQADLIAIIYSSTRVGEYIKSSY